MKRALILALLLTSSTAALTGCKAFQTVDPATGQPKIDDTKVQAAQATATTAGAIFGPIGSAIGIGLAGVIGAYAAKLKGKEIGYDQGAKDAGKELPSAVK